MEGEAAYAREDRADMDVAEDTEAAGWGGEDEDTIFDRGATGTRGRGERRAAGVVFRPAVVGGRADGICDRVARGGGVSTWRQSTRVSTRRHEKTACST
jgi:hypothetical protein